MSELGEEDPLPTLLATDNLANQQVSNEARASARSRFFLIRQHCLHQRVADGHLVVVHIPDAENPSDFLTKFVPEAKTAASVAYAMGG